MKPYRYTETKVALDAAGVPLSATGRVTLDTGWRAALDPEDRKKASKDHAELPPVTDQMPARVLSAAAQAKKTRAPKRFSEGDLVEEMKSAWRYEDDPAERAKLKEARGIGTPATRDTIIAGLKSQEMLETKGKHIVPTARGEAVICAVETACPELAAPALTARLEQTLDGVLTGQSTTREAVERVCASARSAISALIAHGETARRLDARRALGERPMGPPSEKAIAVRETHRGADCGQPIPAETASPTPVVLSRYIDR